MQGLSPRQREVLAVIEETIDRTGIAPTVREIGDRMGIRSTNGVCDHLKALEKKGVLRRDPVRARALVLVRPDPRSVALSALAAISVVAILLTLVAPARAQDDGLDVGRGVAHECGLGCSEGEVAAIAAAARSRCERCSWSRSMRLAMPRFFSGRTDRPYFLGLSRAASMPGPFWPSPLAWPTQRARWLALLAIADRVVRGEIAPSCSPNTWGGRQDHDRIERLTARGVISEIDCGATRNRFFVYVPRGRVRVEVD